jgi:hypothetical protein
MMDDDQFARKLKLSTIYVDLMKSRRFFEGVEGLELFEDCDKRTVLNCLEIVADTFVEMQRRLGVKPIFRVKAT